MSLLSAGKRTYRNTQKYLSETIGPMDVDFSSPILKRLNEKLASSWSISSNFGSRWRRPEEENNNKNVKNRKKTNASNRKFKKIGKRKGNEKTEKR